MESYGVWGGIPESASVGLDLHKLLTNKMVNITITVYQLLNYVNLINDKANKTLDSY